MSEYLSRVSQSCRQYASISMHARAKCRTLHVMIVEVIDNLYNYTVYNNV